LLSPCLEINERGRLAISGCDAVELAGQYGTPLYVMSEDEVRRVCKSYVQSFQKFYGAMAALSMPARPLAARKFTVLW